MREYSPMKKILFLAAMLVAPIGFLSFSTIKVAGAAEGAQAPIVLELFTSQSCSSCPAADKLMAEIAAEKDNIIALSCNVTYWNHLHWKDTLSKEFCTHRQRQYVQTLNSRGPYTPQMVINGRHAMVGSRNGEIRRAIHEDTKAGAVKPIDLALSGDNLVINLPETPGNDTYALLLLPHGDAHEQAIPSGENKGRNVTYTNPVQHVVSLGTWDGSTKMMDYDISFYKKAEGFVVLAQKNGPTGAVIAAAQIKR